MVIYSPQHRSWRCIMRGYARVDRGRHGPPGGVGYVYTQKHTDQENESVNHIKYLCIRVITGLCCDHKRYMGVITNNVPHSTCYYVTIGNI